MLLFSNYGELSPDEISMEKSSISSDHVESAPNTLQQPLPSSICILETLSHVHQETETGRFLTALVITVKNGKLPKCPWAVEETNKLWHFNIKKCYGLETMIELQLWA